MLEEASCSSSSSSSEDSDDDEDISEWNRNGELGRVELIQGVCLSV